MLKIPGLGLFRETDISPCSCGGSLFWAGKDRVGVVLRCVNCLPPKGEVLAFVDMERREVRRGLPET